MTDRFGYVFKVPGYEQQKIEKKDFGQLPSYLQPLIASYDYVYRVKVTPIVEKSSQPPQIKLPCRVTVSADYGKRQGNLNVDNQGRTPANAPPPDQDDLRPCTYIVWGKGVQVFEVIFTRFPALRSAITADFQ